MKALFILLIFPFFLIGTSALSQETHLNSIYLYGNPDDFHKEPEPKKGIFFKDITIVKKEKLIEKLTPFLNQEITNELVNQIKKEIGAFFEKIHHPLILINLPEQDITNGSVAYIIIESKLGEIKIEGNKHVKKEAVLKQIRARPNENIDIEALTSDIAWMNQNPFSNTSLLLSPGEKINTTDVELTIQDRRPIRVYAGSNNDGTIFSKRNRIFFGANVGDLFFYNTNFSYQYTTAYDFNTFWAHTGNYVAFLPYKHILTIFGGYSRVHPEIEGLDSNGKTTQLSGRYEVPIGKVYGNLQQLCGFGFDWKTTNNNILNIADPTQAIVTNTINLTQFLFSYSLNCINNKHRIFLKAEAFLSPFKWFNDQTSKDFSELHKHAKARYGYLKVHFTDIYDFYQGFLLSLQVKGQITTSNLIPTEQYQIGGEDSVRGYENNLVYKDNAFIANVEVWTPAAKALGRRFKKVDDQLNLIAFLDYGCGVNQESSNGGNNAENLLGIGTGLRYNIPNHVNVKFDWGIPLTALFGKKRQQLYLQVLVSY